MREEFRCNKFTCDTLHVAAPSPSVVAVKILEI